MKNKRWGATLLSAALAAGLALSVPATAVAEEIPSSWSVTDELLGGSEGLLNAESGSEGVSNETADTAADIPSGDETGAADAADGEAEAARGFELNSDVPVEGALVSRSISGRVTLPSDATQAHRANLRVNYYYARPCEGNGVAAVDPETLTWQFTGLQACSVVTVIASIPAGTGVSGNEVEVMSSMARVDLSQGNATGVNLTFNSGGAVSFVLGSGILKIPNLGFSALFAVDSSTGARVPIVPGAGSAEGVYSIGLPPGSYYLGASSGGIERWYNGTTKGALSKASAKKITVKQFVTVQVPGGVIDTRFPFTDVAANYTHRPGIVWMYNKGYVANAAKYNPTNATTRGAMATMLMRMKEPNYKPSASLKLPYTDVKKTDTHYRSIAWMYERKYAASAPKFNADAAMSRGALATFLYRMEAPSYKPSGKLPFTDVKKTDTHYKGISWMYDNGYAAYSSSNTKFNATTSTTRGAMATFLTRIYK